MPTLFVGYGPRSSEEQVLDFLVTTLDAPDRP